MDIKTKGFTMPDGNTHIFIPPSPTETERGGIKAKKKTTEEVEVAVGDDDKLYVPSVPDEKIIEAVNIYLDENPPTTGATAEQAIQIQKNTDDVTDLKNGLSILNREVMGYEINVDTPAKYYKISFDEVYRSDRDAISESAAVSEVSFYDSDDVKQTVSTVVANSEYGTGYDALKVIDDDLTTMWSSKEVSGVVHSLTFSLASPAIVTKLGIVPRVKIEAGVPNNFTVYASMNCIDWVEIANFTNQKDNWVEGEWRYFDLQSTSIEYTVPSLRDDLDIVTIFAETDPSTESKPSELLGLINNEGNCLIIYGDDETFGKPYISDCENILPSQYNLNVTSSDGITFSSYYRYLIINGDGSGTGNAYTYITGHNRQPLPEVLKAGDTYKLIIFVNKDALPISTSLRCCIAFYDESGTQTATRSHYFYTNREFTNTVPENSTQWRVSFEGIARDQVWDNVKIYPVLILNDSTLVEIQDHALLSGESVSLHLSLYSELSFINTFQYSHSYKYKIDTKTYVDNHVSDVKLSYTTPEDFGAVGDGIFNDTESVNACLDYAFNNNIPARMYKTYLVSDSVKIQSDMDVYINSLIYTGNDAAVLMDCARSQVYIKKLKSSAKGVCLRADTTRIEYNLIRLGHVACATHCISLEGTAKAIYQNKFEFRYLKAGGDGYYCITNQVVPAVEYCTENTFYGGQCTNADWAYYGTGGNCKFYDIEVESNIKGGFCFISSANALICGDRHAESSRDGEYPFIKITTPGGIETNNGNSVGSLRYISPIGLPINEIDISEVSTQQTNDNGFTTYLESHGSLGKIDCRITPYKLTGSNNATIHQYFSEGALIWGPVLIFQGVPHKSLTVTESLDLRTIGEYTPALPSVFEIGCENCEIHLHPTYCFMGMNKFEVIQTDTYQATIYDYYSGNVIFDGLTYGAGRFEVSTYLNADFARIDGTGMAWEVNKLSSELSDTEVSTYLFGGEEA